MDPVISLSRVSKHFGGKQALKEVSLNVNSGEIFGFLGPNGAGKTTTIRCLMDFIRPDTGSIKLFGQSITKYQSFKKDVGYLAAENQLLDKWNARQHIEFYAQIKGSEGKAGKLLSELDLDPHLQVRHMSTGNRQKLGFILAFTGDPKLLILDEPTRGLDPLLQNEIYKILKDYVSKDGTIFISSHNLSEVERICTNVGIIRDGRIVADKSMNDVHKLKVHIITVSYKQGSVNLSPSKDVEIIDKSDNKLVLKVHGDINHVIHELSKHEISDLEVIHAPLEDVFMEFYKS